jgi:hypothetical protein
MNTAQRILLAARLWLHNVETESADGVTDTVREEIKQSIENRGASMNRYQDQNNQSYQHSHPHNHGHPASIGKDNQIIMDSLTKAKKVAVTLSHVGHRVLDIRIDSRNDSRNARVTINASNRCHMLGGAMIKLCRMGGIEEKTMAANIDGVQVEWVITSKMSRAFNE